MGTLAQKLQPNSAVSPCRYWYCCRSSSNSWCCYRRHLSLTTVSCGTFIIAHAHRAVVLCAKQYSYSCAYSMATSGNYICAGSSRRQFSRSHYGLIVTIYSIRSLKRRWDCLRTASHVGVLSRLIVSDQLYFKHAFLSYLHIQSR